MRICWAISGFSSMFSLTIRTAPLVARTVFSRIGPSCLQGPHQGAQKSTITGASKEPSTTSVMKVAVVTSFTAAGPAPAPPIRASLGIALLVCVYLTTWRHAGAMTKRRGGEDRGRAPPSTRHGRRLALQSGEIDDARRMFARGNEAQQIGGA